MGDEIVVGWEIERDELELRYGVLKHRRRAGWLGNIRGPFAIFEEIRSEIATRIAAMKPVREAIVEEWAGADAEPKALLVPTGKPAKRPKRKPTKPAGDR